MIIPSRISISHKKFDKHNQLKDKLINLINEGDADNLKQNDAYFSDEIHRLDWLKSNDFEGPWTKFILDDLSNHFKQVIKEIGYKQFVIRNLWYQQYNKNGTHGWHTHHHNYTGVYFLEFKNSPPTQLKEQYGQKDIFSIDVKEGDIIMFPSFIIHRAPKNNGDRKTIISFNIDFDYPNDELVQ